MRATEHLSLQTIAPRADNRRPHRESNCPSQSRFPTERDRQGSVHSHPPTTTNEIAMRCRHCQTENPLSSRYCSWCGARLEIACAECGHLCPPATQFCTWCGSMLDPPAAPRRDGGERKQATILFADIVGSPHLISRLDAEDAMGR